VVFYRPFGGDNKKHDRIVLFLSVEIPLLIIILIQIGLDFYAVVISDSMLMASH